MTQFEYWMTTDLMLGSSQVQVIHGQTFTQDNLGNRVGVIVLDGGEPATLNGTVTGYVIRADGGTVLVTGATDGNRAYIDLPESAYAVPGQIQIAIRLVSSEAKTVLGAVSAYVQRTATGTIIDPGHVIPDIDDLLAQIERMEQGTAAAEEAAENAVAAVGAPFDETADYVYGDYVTHNGALYMAAEDITAGSPFNPGQWQKINVMDTVGTAVLYTPQALSSAQRLQASENIDALTKGWGQTLTADQKQAVRDKIGLSFIDWNLNYTDAQKQYARRNFNAADIGNAKTPEMYGAKGDGVTDDGNALLSAFSEASAAGVPLVFTYGKTYAIGRFVQMTGHRINVYGNGATIKVLTGTSTLNEVLYISDDDDGQFPDTKGKGLIENLTIDCNGLAKCGIHIGIAKGYELQNLDICGFTEKGLFITSGFEIFCHNIRIAGSGVAGSVGLRMDTSDSRFVNIVTKNVAVGIENHGVANYYTHVHAWNTIAAIAPTSIMFDSYADLHASDCYVDTCAIGIYQHSGDAVEIDGLTIVNSGSLMSNTPTVFKLTDPSYAARIHSTGMVYLSDADYNMFEADVSQYAKDYDWLANNDSSTHGMGNMPNAYAITEEIADLKSAIVQNKVEDIPLIEKKLSHIKTANVFDKTAAVSGYLESNGDVVANDRNKTSGFIPVNVGDVIKTYYIASSSVYAANMGAVCGYNANKEFVSGTRSTYINTYTIPDGVSYIRFSVGNGMVDTYMMIVNGSQPTAYIPYENHYVATKDFIDSAVGTYGFAVIPIAKEETDFWAIERSQNLFNKNDVVSGEYYNTNGIISSANNVFRSLVELDGAGTYSFNVMGNFFGLANAVKIPLFDKNKSYLKTITGSTEETTPTNKNLMTLVVSQQDIDDGVAYIGYSEHLDNLNDLMVVKSSAYPESYIPYYKRWTLPDLQLTEENAGELPTNPLYGKTVVFDGDSICAGNDSALDGYGNGWAARIGKDNGMDWHNTGVGGGTITSGLYFSGGSARHWISAYIDTIHSNYPDLDYLILEGGTNDADILFGQTAKIGEIDETDYNRDNVADHFDDETYCGALDTLFYKAQQYYPKKKIGFIIAQKMGRALNADGNPDPYVANRRHFFDLAIQACKKWGIPYIDLWYDGQLNPNSTAMYDPQYNTVQTATEHGLCYFDGQHLTGYGYNVISPKIAAWMKTL